MDSVHVIDLLGAALPPVALHDVLAEAQALELGLTRYDLSRDAT